MLTVRTLDSRYVACWLKPRFEWRVTDLLTGRSVTGIVATTSWGALRAGAQELGVEPDRCEVEVGSS